ncbi:MAG: hypothetical protein QF541_08810 [Lentisphaeria bacterium]|nr:hypothetical protein [Lentisphaeria bacterium]
MSGALSHSAVNWILKQLKTSMLYNAEQPRKASAWRKNGGFPADIRGKNRRVRTIRLLGSFWRRKEAPEID